MVALTRNKEKVAEYKKHARALVEQMTLEEKVFQMLQTAARLWKATIWELPPGISQFLRAYRIIWVTRSES